jgi:hypothetical protein
VGIGLSGNGLSENGLSGNGLSGNGLSGNGLSGNGLSENGLSGNGVEVRLEPHAVGAMPQSTPKPHTHAFCVCARMCAGARLRACVRACVWMCVRVRGSHAPTLLCSGTAGRLGLFRAIASISGPGRGAARDGDSRARRAAAGADPIPWHGALSGVLAGCSKGCSMGCSMGYSMGTTSTLGVL